MSNKYIKKIIEEHVENLCLLDSYNYWALSYIKYQTPEACIKALKKNGYSLQFIKEQTRELCLIAVKQSGFTLHYVKEQTPEICLATVNQDGINY